MTRSFAVGLACGMNLVLWGGVVWWGLSNLPQPATYFHAIRELPQLDAKARSARLAVVGRIREGSIVHKGNVTTFILAEHNGPDPGQQLTVVYKGHDLPDTFRDEAQGLVVGALGKDGVFHAVTVQAKWG